MPPYDDEYVLQRYRALRAAEPALFKKQDDYPIQILLETDQIREAQRYAGSERAAAGWRADDLRVGLLADDVYIGYIVRDAVAFPDGRLGLYNRVIATGGVVILPIVDDGIALIRIFRHAPRRWMLEAPQGHLLPADDPIEVAKRELAEEMGTVPTEITPLGTVFTSSAMTSENLKMFAARIKAVGAPQRSEGIESVKIIRHDAIDAQVRDGTISDGPTMSLILRARLAGLL
jgi:8-oxo-dGTP pyrophosphatase MutT (NUDIX family)